MDYYILISYYTYAHSLLFINVSTHPITFSSVLSENGGCVFTSQSLFHLHLSTVSLTHNLLIAHKLFFHSQVTLYVLCHQHVCRSSCKHTQVHMCVQCLICHDMSHDIIAGLACMHTTKLLGIQLTGDL